MNELFYKLRAKVQITGMYPQCHIGNTSIVTLATRELWNTDLCLYLEKKRGEKETYFKQKIHTIPRWNKAI